MSQSLHEAESVAWALEQSRQVRVDWGVRTKVGLNALGQDLLLKVLRLRVLEARIQRGRTRLLQRARRQLRALGLGTKPLAQLGGQARVLEGLREVRVRSGTLEGSLSLQPVQRCLLLEVVANEIEHWPPVEWFPERDEQLVDQGGDS